MKILIDSFNRSLQSEAGGVQKKILNYYQSLYDSGHNVKLFNKWTDKISDFDILHLFKLSQEYYDEVMYAKQKGLKIVLSSIVAIEGRQRIKQSLLLSKFLPFSTVHGISANIMKQCDAIITETELEKTFIQDVYGIDSCVIHSIPNGVADVSEGADVSLIKRRLNIDSEFILHIARFDHNKNQLGFIKAVRETGIPVVFIGGPGPGEEKYYEECKKMANSKMIFLGWMSQQDPLFKACIKGAKVVALSSFKETFGYVIFEGALAGANIAVTNAIPLEEWGLDGLMTRFDPQSETSMREGVQQAFNLPRNPQLAKKVAEKMSLQSICNQHVDIYKSILE